MRVSSRATGSPTTSASARSGTSESASTWTASASASTSPANAPTTSSDCWDAEAEIDGDWIEITGFSYRSDYDLSKHDAHSDEDFTVFRQYDEPKMVERATVDPDMSYLGPEFGGDAGRHRRGAPDARRTRPGRVRRRRGDRRSRRRDLHRTGRRRPASASRRSRSRGEHITPHVVEPSFGVDRVLYTVLDHAYERTKSRARRGRDWRLEPELAPTTRRRLPADGQGRDGRAGPGNRGRTPERTASTSPTTIRVTSAGGTADRTKSARRSVSPSTTKRWKTAP